MIGQQEDEPNFRDFFGVPSKKDSKISNEHFSGDRSLLRMPVRRKKQEKV